MVKGSASRKQNNGLPMYRTDKWQNHFGVPLPASTQWELIEAASETPQIIYETLIGVAAHPVVFAAALRVSRKRLHQ